MNCCLLATIGIHTGQQWLTAEAQVGERHFAEAPTHPGAFGSQLQLRSPQADGLVDEADRYRKRQERAQDQRRGDEDRAARGPATGKRDPHEEAAALRGVGVSVPPSR